MTTTKPSTKYDAILAEFLTKLPKRFQIVKKEAQYLPNDSGLFLSGPVGVGKTFAAIQSAVEYMCETEQTTPDNWTGEPRALKIHEYRQHMRFITTTQLLLDIRKTFQGEGPSESEIVSNLSRYRILVLDDFGTEKQSDWADSMLYLIINNRINDCKPTIITSNLSIKEIAKVNPRLASRFAGMECVAMQGGDRRLKK